MTDLSHLTVRDNPARSRFEMDVDGTTAVLIYRAADGVLSLVHSEVDRRLEGRGYGSQLVRGALEIVRERGLKIRPRCGFVANYIARHPEVHDLLA